MTTAGRRRGVLLREISKFNDHKMITRRNWLLKCSIFANIVVLLYICSHVLVGSNTNNFGMSSSGGSSAFLIQQFSPTSNNLQQQQKTPTIPSAQSLQDEQELMAILRNKEQELQKQIKMQEVIQVS
jgi:preprotein translocase subunit SecF